MIEGGMLMKRIVCGILVATVMLAMVGCSESPAASERPSADVTTSASAAESASATQTEEPTPELPTEPTAAASEDPAAGQIALNQDGVVITYMGIEDADTEYKVKIRIENQRDDDVMVQTRDTSVDGIMTDVLFSSTIKAGMMANDTLDFLKSQLGEDGIATFQEVETSFLVANPDTAATIFETEAVALPPKQDQSAETSSAIASASDDQGVAAEVRPSTDATPDASIAELNTTKELPGGLTYEVNSAWEEKVGDNPNNVMYSVPGGTGGKYSSTISILYVDVSYTDGNEAMLRLFANEAANAYGIESMSPINDVNTEFGWAGTGLMDSDGTTLPTFVFLFSDGQSLYTVAFVSYSSLVSADATAIGDQARENFLHAIKLNGQQVVQNAA